MANDTKEPGVGLIIEASTVNRGTGAINTP